MPKLPKQRLGTLPEHGDLAAQSVTEDVRYWPKADIGVCAAHIGF